MNILKVKDSQGNWNDIPAIVGKNGEDYVLTSEDKEEIAGMVEIPVEDVQVNGASILNEGVANIPVATSRVFGTVKASTGFGVGVIETTGNNLGRLFIDKASSTGIKGALEEYRPIVPLKQHEAVFYGLAKASSDTTQSASSNAVGVYTDEAKIAIQKMLGIYEAPWELIREDTFTNAEEADHIITVDGNGNAFELTDVILMFETPKQAVEAKKGYYGQVQYKHNSGNVFVIGSTNWTQAANGEPMGFYQFIERRDGLIFASGTAAGTTGTPANLRYTPVGGFSVDSPFMPIIPIPVNDNKTVTRIDIKAVTGTGHYRIYGKRKWQ